MRIKRYSRTGPLVLAGVVLPYTLFINTLVFGGCIFGSFSIFFSVFLYSSMYWTLVCLVYGVVSGFVQHRFPGTALLVKRISWLLPVFYILNILAVSGFFFLFNKWRLAPCPVLNDRLVWAILYACIMSTFITFIKEAMANWGAWKRSIAESEKLRNAYQRGRVMGLRGQINPHFLFNCFNTLSGLIQENEEKAERFLDEMTRVHRYLLRGDDEQLVPLEEELKFAASYLYLAKERFGTAISYETNVNGTGPHLPPLTMQVLLEHIIYHNALNKTDPLQIKISTENQCLAVSNTLHPKIVLQPYPAAEAFENLLQKYAMLGGGEIQVSEHDGVCTYTLPLFYPKEEKNEVG